MLADVWFELNFLSVTELFSFLDSRCCLHFPLQKLEFCCLLISWLSHWPCFVSLCFPLAVALCVNICVHACALVFLHASVCTCYGITARKCGPVAAGKLLTTVRWNLTQCKQTTMFKKRDDVSVNDDSMNPVLLQWIYYEVGFLVCTTIGVLFVVLTPIIGMCFCVCRCCENCGGEMHQRQRKNIDCQRGFFTASLIATSIFIMWVIIIFSLVSVILFIWLFSFHERN